MFYKPAKIEPVWQELQTKGGPIEIIIVEVMGEEYERVKNFSSNMWANKKRGKWGSGLINTPQDEYRAERMGILGEMAFAKIFGYSVNLNYCEGGEIYDFEIMDKKIDVKTSYKYQGAAFIKAVNVNGSVIKLVSDYYVFAFIMSERLNYAKIALVGFEKIENIKNMDYTKGRSDDHLNYEMQYEDLISIRDLLDELH